MIGPMFEHESGESGMILLPDRQHLILCSLNNHEHRAVGNYLDNGESENSDKGHHPGPGSDRADVAAGFAISYCTNTVFFPSACTSVEITSCARCAARFSNVESDSA